MLEYNDIELQRVRVDNSQQRRLVLKSIEAKTREEGRQQLLENLSRRLLETWPNRATVAAPE